MRYWNWVLFSHPLGTTFPPSDYLHLVLNAQWLCGGLGSGSNREKDAWRRWRFEVTGGSRKMKDYITCEKNKEKAMIQFLRVVPPGLTITKNLPRRGRHWLFTGFILFGRHIQARRSCAKGGRTPEVVATAERGLHHRSSACILGLFSSTHYTEARCYKDNEYVEYV